MFSMLTVTYSPVNITESIRIGIEYSDLEFMEKTGIGGFGAVSKGRWISENKIVAIKTLMELDDSEVLGINLCV